MIVYNIVKGTDFLSLFQYISELESVQGLSKEQRLRSFDKEAAIMDKIRNAIQWHVAPLVSLGQGHGSLALKFRAILHAFGLLSHDRDILAQLLRSVVSWHSDYGTEIGIARIAPVPIEQVLPYIHQTAPKVKQEQRPTLVKEEMFDEGPEIKLEFGSARAEDDFGQEQPAVDSAAAAVAEAPLADVSGCLEVPGMMHVCHNATNGLRKSLGHLEEVLMKHKKLARMLRVKETKDRVLAACFAPGLGLGFASEIRRFHAEVYFERWHNVANCITCILQLEVALRSCWTVNKHLAGTDKHSKLVLNAGTDDEHDSGLALIDEAVNSPFFWMYMHMLSHISDVQTIAVRWVNGCSCHWGLDVEEYPLKFQQLWLSCPLRGRRCHDMAAGEFFGLVQGLYEVRSSRLLASVPPGLDPTERRAVIEHFERAKIDLITTYTMKCTFWQEPP